MEKDIYLVLGALAGIGLIIYLVSAKPEVGAELVDVKVERG